MVISIRVGFFNIFFLLSLVVLPLKKQERFCIIIMYKFGYIGKDAAFAALII